MKSIKTIALFGMLAAAANINASDYSLAPIDLTVEKGKTAQLSIAMNNNDLSVISFQCDLYLPEGVTVECDDYGTPLATLAADRIVDHIVNAAVQPNGEVRYLSYSNNNRIYKGSEGVIIYTPLVVNAEPGVYNITIKDGSLTHEGDYVETFCPEVSATLTVTEPEIKRYGDNQLYINDLTISQGDQATILIGCNSLSDVYEYAADITLPEGVAVSSLNFTDAVNVENFTNTWSQEGNILKISGEYGGGRKDLPADAGDVIIATAVLNTSELSSGEYDINVGSQKLFNDDDLYPENYVAILTVEGGAPIEKCAVPEISIDADGNVVVNCETENAQMHTTISAADHKVVDHSSDESIQLTGQYLITSYASAPGKADSEPATVTLAWLKGFDPTSGVLEVGTERAIIVRQMALNIEVIGAIVNEPIKLYDLRGEMLYEGKATATSFVVPFDCNPGTIYLVNIGEKTIKFVF